jgi:hypothetical protein
MISHPTVQIGQEDVSNENTNESVVSHAPHLTVNVEVEG